ncbi:putative ABC transport system permease protein [Streptosporangium album]|uniref:Putative ABC transport system permease protein n=1 Tax=Streptosporangium album TaxID=47479 RepID=A0A7W7S5B6_9ACTN|nr:FtsX-like permease family protein [Streptosporangium album]MBB4944154.1 putative ABC transport system permease protein [Streptosporangium album]
MFVAIRDLRFAKGRFALMGAVVLLITLLVTMLSGLTAGLAQDNISAIGQLPADRIVFSAGKGTNGDLAKPSFSDSRITDKTWQEWQKVDGVPSAERLGITMGRLTSGTDDESSTAAAVFGVQPGGELAKGSGGVVDTGKVVLSSGLAKKSGLTTGAKVQIFGRDFTVAGSGGAASYSHTPVAWISIGDWEWMGRQGGADTVATVLALRTAADPDFSAADERLRTTTVAIADAPAAIGSFSSENGSLQLMRAFLFAISALVIGAFFTVWTIQRRGDVAVLKALGASTAYLLRDALAQAVIVLLLGAGIGGAIGAGVGALAEGTVPFVLSAATTIVPVTVMILLGALGAALAIRKITSVDPLTALGASR